MTARQKLLIALAVVALLAFAAFGEYLRATLHIWFWQTFQK